MHVKSTNVLLMKQMPIILRNNGDGNANLIDKYITANITVKALLSVDLFLQKIPPTPHFHLPNATIVLK